jgi:hypothetical protein
MTEPPTANDDLFRQYLEGAATPAELAELERRLARPDCADAFAGVCRLDAWLRILLKEESQVAQTKGLCTAIDSARRRSRRGRAWRGVAVALAILIICVGLWRILPTRQPVAEKVSNAELVAQPSSRLPSLSPSSSARTDNTHLAAAIAMLGMVTANTFR